MATLGFLLVLSVVCCTLSLADKDCEIGQDYKLQVQVNCACGGWEGDETDVNIKVFYAEGEAGTYHKIGRKTTSSNDDATEIWANVATITCKNITQMMYIEVWDEDFNPDDYLGVTKKFEVPYITTDGLYQLDTSNSDYEVCGDDARQADCRNGKATVEVSFQKAKPTTSYQVGY